MPVIHGLLVSATCSSTTRVLLAGLGVDVVVEQAGRARRDRAELHLALDLGLADVVAAHEDGDRLLGLGLRVLDLGLDDLEALDEAGVLA
jgi:hypothetical protein